MERTSPERATRRLTGRDTQSDAIGSQVLRTRGRAEMVPAILFTLGLLGQRPDVHHWLTRVLALLGAGTSSGPPPASLRVERSAR